MLTCHTSLINNLLCDVCLYSFFCSIQHLSLCKEANPCCSRRTIWANASRGRASLDLFILYLHFRCVCLYDWNKHLFLWGKYSGYASKHSTPFVIQEWSNYYFLRFSEFQVAFDEMQNKVKELNNVITQNPPDMKKLQLILQGSVSVQVWKIKRPRYSRCCNC